MKRIALILLIAFSGTQLAASQSETYENLKRHVYTLASDSLEGRMVGSIGSKKAGDYIAREFAKMGVRPLFEDNYFHEFKYTRFYNEIPGRNVIAILDGTDPELRQEYIIVGAHYDHLGTKEKEGKTIIYPGADDNASGVAAMLEVARKLVKTPPARSIVFVAFDAEEQGLIGSMNFIKDEVLNPQDIKLMFSVDMVGGVKYGKILEYSGVDLITEGKTLFEVPNPDNLPVKLSKTGNNPFIGTDSDSFVEKNIPTVHVNTGTKTPYHKPEDTAQAIDYEGLEQVTNHLTSVVVKCADDATGIEASKTLEAKATNKPRITFGATLGLGTNHQWYTSGPVTGKNNFAGNIGLYARIPVYEFIGIQPEVLFERKYACAPGGQFYTDAISIPLNATLTAGNSFVFGMIQLGGYYDYILSGKAADETMMFETGGFNRNEFGLSFGLGFGVGKFSLRYVSKYALTDIHSETPADGANRRNQTGYVSFGYKF